MSERENLYREYPVVVRLPVEWGHMDAFRHVNHTYFFRYLESARIAYGDRTSTAKFLKEEGIGPILAATCCNFLKPLRYPDSVHVGCRTTHISSSEMHQEYAVYSEHLKAIAARGTARIVAYDYVNLKKSRFPKAFIEKIIEQEKGRVVLEADSPASG